MTSVFIYYIPTIAYCCIMGRVGSVFLCPVVDCMNFSSDGVEYFRKELQTHRLLNNNIGPWGFFKSCFVSTIEAVN